MIEIYNSDNKNFDKNGDMTLEPLICTYSVTINTVYSVDLIHPIDSIGRWKYIKEFSVVKGKLPNGEYGLFTITQVAKQIDSIVAKAIPYSFFTLAKTNLKDVNIENQSGQETLNTITAGTDIIGHSDIVDLNSITFFKQNKMQAISGDSANTFLKIYGGEILPIGRDLYVNYKLGGDYGNRIAYGFNLEEINLNRDFSGIATRIYPYIIKSDNTVLELPEGYIDSPIIHSYSQVYEEYVNLTDKIKLKSSDNADGLTDNEAISKMREIVNNLYSKGIDKPVTSGDINFITLENTEEYKDFKSLVEIDLGDYVTISHTDIGIYTKERCTGFVWDFIEEEYTSVHVGGFAKNEFDIQAESVNRLNNILNDNGEVKSDMLTGLINAAKVKFSAMRDIAQPQQVRAMIFEDKIKASKTYGALCLGTSGLEIADTRTPDDKDWEWSTFITGKSVIADYLVGKLKTVLIENIDGSFQIDLNQTGGANFYNNGQKAINISNNSLNLYDWAYNGEFIGSLQSTVRTNNDNKPFIELSNSKTSAIAIGYPVQDGTINSYVEFDKFNISGREFHKPIEIVEDLNFNGKSLYRAYLFNDDKSGWIYVNSDKAEMARGNYYIHCMTDKVSLGQGQGNGIIIKDDGIHLYGNIYVGDKLVNL